MVDHDFEKFVGQTQDYLSKYIHIKIENQT